jgi:hypothetical protein
MIRNLTTDNPDFTESEKKPNIELARDKAVESDAKT